MDTNGKDGQTRRYKTSSTGSKKPKKQLNKEETRVIGTDRVKNAKKATSKNSKDPKKDKNGKKKFASSLPFEQRIIVRWASMCANASKK